MHILIIHQAFAAINEPGGTRHHELARHLVQRGHRVTIIASPVSYLTGTTSKGEETLEEGIRIIRAYVYTAHNKSFVHRVFAFISFMVSSFFAGLRVRDVDLIWGTSPPIFQAVTALLLARIKRIPFLLEIRDLWPAFAIAVGVLTNKPLIAASQWLERVLYRNADRVMVNSPGFIDHVKDLGAKRVALIPNGADVRMFDPVREADAQSGANSTKSPYRVLYAGAHGMSNDLGVVLDAAKIIEEENIEIVLLGDGKEKANLQARAKELTLKNVTFLPSVPKAEMAAALADCDACLAILKPIEMYKTTYPNKVFDYMAASKPVVLAIDGVVRDVVDAAECGVFAQPGDPQALANAVLILAKDPARSHEMGLAGRAYIEKNFDRTALAEELVEILEGMVK